MLKAPLLTLEPSDLPLANLPHIPSIPNCWCPHPGLWCISSLLSLPALAYKEASPNLSLLVIACLPHHTENIHQVSSKSNSGSHSDRHLDQGQIKSLLIEMVEALMLHILDGSKS